MATPMKTNAYAIVPDLSVCVACKKNSKQRYYVRKNKGDEGPSMKIVNTFYELCFDCSENNGAFLCLPCNRMLQRINKMNEESDKLSENVDRLSQKFIIKHKSKRMRVTTPSSIAKPGKRVARETDIGTGLTGSTDTPMICSPYKPVSRRGLDFNSTLSLSEKQTPSTCSKSKRKEMCQYININHRKKVELIVSCLASGSMRKCTRLLLSHTDVNIKNKVLAGISDVIHQECKSLQKKEEFRKTTVSDMEFNLDETSKCLQSAPLLWGVLNSIGENKNKTSDSVKVTTAACILLSSRSKFLCKLQHNVGISLYNHQLQKEGFAILHKLGVSVCHSTLQRTLNAAALCSDDAMLKLKSSVEQNLNQCSTNSEPCMDHAYAVHEQADLVSPVSCNPGYRFNMDNLDFHIRVRDMTESHQNQCKHYVQLMAVKDRVNCEHLSDNVPVGDLNQVENQQFIPSAVDNSDLREDMIHMISIILVRHLQAFKAFIDVYPEFFQHPYSDQMKEKSVVLPLGILDKSENKMNDMIEILEYLHKFVPNSRSHDEVQNVSERQDKGDMRSVPLGGDQLTCERIRGAHVARFDADTPEERLEGCFSMVEDFHEKMNFLQMIMDRFYKSSSAREPGTLYQLKSVINRRNVTSTVTKDYHADSAFIDLVGESHVVCLAVTHFNMANPDAPCSRIPHGLDLADHQHKKRILRALVGELVDKHIMNEVSRTLNHLEDRDQIGDQGPHQDGVYNYATNFIKFWLLRRISVIATRSGDGIRILRHWKYAFLLYHNAHKTKYRLEAFLLLAGILALFTERQQHQVIWNRFINLSGGSGKNLDGDYVMELLNKYAKSRVKLIGPNHTPDAVLRIGKTMMFCHDISRNLENEIGAAPVSRDHKAQDVTSDMQKTVCELLKAKVFHHIPGRNHASFPNEPSDIFRQFDVAAFHQWLATKKSEYARHKRAF